MKFGLISHVVGEQDSRKVLEETIFLAQRAEASGFDSFWVAQHHFGSHRGHSPSPLILLAAIARETSTINLGTAVIAAALENPIRLAEDASMVDALSGDRLQLGLGAGADAQSSFVFGIEHSQRHEILSENLNVLLAELDGERLCPEGSELRKRLWLATGSEEGFSLASSVGMGVLVGRKGSPRIAEDSANAQRMNQYRQTMTAKKLIPRLGLSRVAFCETSIAAAHQALTPGIEQWINQWSAPGRYPPGYTASDYLASGHISVGTGVQIMAQLATDPCIDQASELLINIPQMFPSITENIKSIERFGSEVIAN